MTELMPWCGTCKEYPSCEPRRLAGVRGSRLFSCIKHSELKDVSNVPPGTNAMFWDYAPGGVDA